MKSIIFLSLFLTTPVFAAHFDTSDLGSTTDYTCLVEIESYLESGYHEIRQNCNSSTQPQVIAKVKVPVTSLQLQLDVITAFRPEFALVSSSQGTNTVQLIFQKL